MIAIKNWINKNKILLIYIGCVIFLILLYLKSFISLFTLAIKYDKYSYHLIIPFLFLYFFVFIKDRPKFEIDFSLKRGLFLLVGGVLIYAVSYLTIPLIYPLLRLFISLLSFCLIFLGINLVFFKDTIFKNNKFSWFILLLLLPLPTKPYEGIISFLQYGSAEGVDIIFRVLDRITGFTYVRNNLYFYFPQLSIYIAKECSGIRSTTALLLTALLAARIFLSTLGGRIVLVVVGVIFSILKNSLRIATLSYLAVKIDPRWITHSDLHENGGFIFFGITLLILIILIFVIKKVELNISKKKKS